jgi:hypothetical protein
MLIGLVVVASLNVGMMIFGSARGLWLVVVVTVIGLTGCVFGLWHNGSCSAYLNFERPNRKVV